MDYWLESQKEKQPLGRQRFRSVNNINMDLGELEWRRVIDRIGLAKNRYTWRVVVKVVMNLHVP
jgi:hypothetical protein